MLFFYCLAHDFLWKLVWNRAAKFSKIKERDVKNKEICEFNVSRLIHSSVFVLKRKYLNIGSNISNTRKSVSSGYPNPEKWVEKTRRSRVFLTDFEVFGYLMKHSFEFLIWLLKPFINLGEIQSRSSLNFMLIKIRYPNHRHGSDFLCFLFMNY